LPFLIPFFIGIIIFVAVPEISTILPRFITY
jgi:hypothetical protein